MKTIRTLLFIMGLFVSWVSYGDVIPDGYHGMYKCVKITNTLEYPDFSLLGATDPWNDQPYFDIPTYIISPDKCLDEGYKFNSLKIFAVSNDYLAGINIIATDWKSNKHAFISSINIYPYGGIVPDDNPLREEYDFYKIAGFTDSTVVLYKWKEIRKYNNGLRDSVKYFDYKGDIQLLSQQIPTGDQTLSRFSGLRIYPNPAKNTLTISTGEIFRGGMLVELYDVSGKKAGSFQLKSAGNTTNFTIDISKLPGGLYFMKIHLGESTEVRKIIISGK
jgi:hypothetical protein